MSAIDKLLPRLEGVRRVGDGRWMAKCPVHGEKTASLSIRDNSGRVLMHCFGCGANGGDVMSALGLALGDLYDAPLAQHRVDRPAGIHPNDALMVLDHEITVAWFLLQDAQTRSLNPAELARLSECAARVGKIRDSVCPVEIKALKEEREARAKKELGKA